MRTEGSEPRRLLIVTTVPQTIRGFLVPFARHLRDHGWEVEAATGPGPAIEEFRDDVDAVWEVSWARQVASAGNVGALRQIRRVMARGRFDVVHVHTPIAALVTRLAAASLGRSRPAIVYTAHGFHFYEGGDPLRNTVYAAVERLGGFWTDREIVINEADYRQALARRIVPRSRLRLFPGIGIDLDHYAPTADSVAAAATLRANLGIASTATVYSMIAEFQPGKNHRAALDAFARLADRTSHLLLAGGGPTEPEVRAQVHDLGLEDRVHFLGVVVDVRPLMLASDATLLPSRREGLSRSVLESLTIGVPVIGGRTRGIRDLVDDDLGILVEPDDVEGLARAMRDVLAFPSHGDLRERSLDRMSAYSIDRVIELHDELYDELTGRHADSTD